MSKLTRRSFLGTAAAGGAALAAGWGSGLTPVRAENSGAGPGIGLIHATDLFRPHNDPDDHFDLATVFAFAAQGRFELLAVMIDHPPQGLAADPDVLAVAQLARITGLAVPVLTGSPRRLDPGEAARPEHRQDIAGVRALLEILRRAPRPVAISIVGSARDVALAGRLEPKLFAARCAGIYLNSGSGTPDKAKAARLEYNVGLDPVSYAAIFDLPCPVYWCPCFEVAPGPGVPMASGEFGTYYRFLQKDLFDRLSPRLQNYFAFMLKQGESDRESQTEVEALRPSWLRTLEAPPDRALLERQGSRLRNMWSTGGFFHAAGLALPALTFDPVRVKCGADGVTEWSPDPRSKDRFLFHVRDREHYAAAQTAALTDLLSTLT
jgi:hypothetical protein